jgi:hypothetical protein
VRVYRLDTAAECASEFIVVNLSRHVESSAINALLDPVLGDTEHKFAHLWIRVVELIKAAAGMIEHPVKHEVHATLVRLVE